MNKRLLALLSISKLVPPNRIILEMFTTFGFKPENKATQADPTVWYCLFFKPKTLILRAEGTQDNFFTPECTVTRSRGIYAVKSHFKLSARLCTRLFCPDEFRPTSQVEDFLHQLEMYIMLNRTFYRDKIQENWNRYKLGEFGNNEITASCMEHRCYNCNFVEFNNHPTLPSECPICKGPVRHIYEEQYEKDVLSEQILCGPTNFAGRSQLSKRSYR